MAQSRHELVRQRQHINNRSFILRVITPTRDAMSSAGLTLIKPLCACDNSSSSQLTSGCVWMLLVSRI